MRMAGPLLVVAGLLLVVGGQSPWVTCSMMPCPDLEGGFGFMVIFERTGLDVGWGFVTAFVGIVMIAIGLARSSNPRAIVVARAAGVATLIIAAVFAARVWVVPEYYSYGPQVGFVATVLGGLIAAVGDPVLRRRSPRQ